MDSAGINWNFRPNTQDEWIYNEVYAQNCYRLPDDMSGKTVIDIGANIGAFAVACLDRGADFVFCFEPDRDSYQNLIAHLGAHERWSAINRAVVGNGRTGSLFLSEPKIDNGIRMTGGQHITTGDEGRAVIGARLGDFLAGRRGSFWLKLDCEGSEHEILADDLPWDRIEKIFGEIHDCGPDANFESLRERLASVGYSVEVEPNPDDPNLALFFASKSAPACKTIVVLTPFRNARRYLTLYFAQLSALRDELRSQGMTLRLVAAEGDSLDGTRDRILSFASEHEIPVTVVDTTHGHIRWGSVEDPVRMRTMSEIMNKALAEFRPEDDIAVWIMSDLKWDTEDVIGLIQDLQEPDLDFQILAPLVFAGEPGGEKIFYDTWAYRRNGERFGNKFPYHPDFYELIDDDTCTVAEIDSAGTCLVISGNVARSCRALDLEAVSFCADARSKGFRIGLSTSWQVHHAPKPQFRLLWIGDALCTTGFAKVTHAMLPVLSETGYDIDVIGINYWGTPHNFPYRIFPANVQGDYPGGELRAKMLVYQAQMEDKPYDAIVYLTDPWNVPGLITELGDLQSEHGIEIPPVIPWLTVDGENVDGTSLNSDLVAKVLSATEFGTKELAIRGCDRPLQTVPFGIDTSIFRPLDKLQARALVSSQEIPPDAFIVGAIATNQLRKRLDLHLAYFAEWVSRYQIPDAYLYLFVSGQSSTGFDLARLVRYYGLQGRVILNMSKLNDQAMAQVYNSFDVYMSLSQGEGFGLTVLEAMACGVPCVVSDWSGLGSWIPDGAACKIPCTATAISSPLNSQAYVIGGLADRNTTVEALANLYMDTGSRRTFSERGIEAAREFRWERSGEGLKQDLENVIESRHRAQHAFRAAEPEEVTT